jgi:hypothetical protein
MIDLAEIVRKAGPQYIARYGDKMPPSHKKALRDIERCRTAQLGGQIFYCTHCEQTHYSYHSCRNRHCPKCQNDRAEQWLEQQHERLLPVPYFMVTFTLPANLHAFARSNQTVIYNLLFRTAAQSLQKLADDPRFVGGKLGMVGILHTWKRDLGYHLHVHFVVTGGGLSPDGSHWRSASRKHLVPVKALSKIFRAKFRDELIRNNLLPQIDAKVWRQAWVVHCKPVGSGKAAFKYLAPYIFRVALSNKRIVKYEDEKVTFSYTDSKTKKTAYRTLNVFLFIYLFLQHILPRGFVKVRYYGILAPKNKHLLQQARTLLNAKSKNKTTNPIKSTLCPNCQQPMFLIATFQPNCRAPPIVQKIPQQNQSTNNCPQSTCCA